uniref:DUF1409 domain-containing protein n=2 Tax=Oryza sativa subsp. japonica TaxID=39947 RepID=A0A5S6R7R8_ORYSJ|nr:Hypothetical protein [Oryza sativa Japonica Group]ABB47081.2 hypothetical protein LOC_Os10g15330 [Oryza sativa Japonica Group]
MDRLLNIPGALLGSIDNIELALIRSATFDRWWAKWKKHLFHQSTSRPQNLHLLTSAKVKKEGQVVGRQIPPKGKASKKHKATAADDLPALDLDVEECLDNEEMEQAIEEAVADVSETREGGQTPPVDPPSLKKVQSPVKIHLSPRSPSPSRQESGEQTPSTGHDLDVGLPEQPNLAAPGLADMLSFDINQFMDEEGEEITSKVLALLNDDVRGKLVEIADRLGSSLDSLVDNCGPIRDRFEEIQRQILDAYANAISPVVYLEQHRLKLERAMQQIADRRQRAELETTIQANRLSIKGDKAKLDEMEAGPSST